MPVGNKKVAVIMGSDSDFEIVKHTLETLDKFNVEYEVKVLSAHRSPEKLYKYIKEAEGSGVEVFIAAAGMSAALSGVIASKTIRPVIGIPIPGSFLDGMDALLSTVQMPPGIPVATVAVGKPGAINAAILAVKILALHDEQLKNALNEYKANLSDSVDKKEDKIKNLLKRS